MEEAVTEEDKRSNASASSASSSESSSEEQPDLKVDEELASAFDKPIVYSLDHGLGRKMYQHKDHGTLHWQQLANISRFECSRLLCDRYTRVNEPLLFAWPFCVQCAT